MDFHFCQNDRNEFQTYMFIKRNKFQTYMFIKRNILRVYAYSFRFG